MSFIHKGAVGAMYNIRFMLIIPFIFPIEDYVEEFIVEANLTVSAISFVENILYNDTGFVVTSEGWSYYINRHIFDLSRTQKIQIGNFLFEHGGVIPTRMYNSVPQST